VQQHCQSPDFEIVDLVALLQYLLLLLLEPLEDPVFIDQLRPLPLTQNLLYPDPEGLSFAL
jgi:hypothetical protein